MRLLPGALICGLAFGQTLEKLPPGLRQIADPEKPADVLIFLSRQPQSEIQQRWMAGVAFSLESAELRRLRGLETGLAYDAWAAQEDADRIRMAVRARIAADARAAIESQQRALENRLQSIGAGNVRRFWMANVVSARVPSGELAKLAEDPAVVRIAENRPVPALLALSVKALGAPAFWNSSFTGKGQAVAVLDTGIRSRHPAFSGLEVTSRVFLEAARIDPCFADDPKSPEDLVGHGTHVAGIIASQGSPSAPAELGVARNLSHLINLKIGWRVDPSCGGGAASYPVDVLDAIQWAFENTPAKIFNYSYGATLSSGDDDLARIFDFLVDVFGIQVTVAAGNGGPKKSTIDSPGNAYNVLSVANADLHDSTDRASYSIHASSSRGPTWDGRAKPDVAAPGTDIVSADYETDGWVSMTGTSMAAPHVAGALALLAQAGISDPRSARALLIQSGGCAGWATDWGWGPVDLSRALHEKDLLVESDVSHGAARYWRGTLPGSFCATLVWNRHLDALGGFLASTVPTLGLFLHSMDNRRLAAFDNSLQNVAQVASDERGEAVLAVRNSSPGPGPDNLMRSGDTESFALALSAAGFQPARGPELAHQCELGASATAGATAPLQCVFRNPGDLPAFDIYARIRLADQPVRVFYVGNVEACGQTPASWDITLPAEPGDYAITVETESVSYSVPINGYSETPISVTPPPAALSASTGSMQITLLAGNSGGHSAVTLRSSGNPLPYLVRSASPWIRYSPETGMAGPTSEIRIWADAAHLTPGPYQGVVEVVSDGALNSPLTITVSLTVMPNRNLPPEVVAAVMTSLPVSNACAAPDPATVFPASTPVVALWFSVAWANAGDRFNVDWISPDGRIYQTQAVDPALKDGPLCRSSSMRLAGTLAAGMPGDWNTVIRWNGIRIAQRPFAVN